MSSVSRPLIKELASALEKMFKESVAQPRNQYVELSNGCHPIPLGRDILARDALIGHLLAKAEAVEATPVEQDSDGYHTFAELYEHRHALMLAFMRSCSAHCWFSLRHADGELPFGSNEWFIVGAELPGAGSITYHLPIRLLEAARRTGASELSTGLAWDGHAANDVVQRLMVYATGDTANPANNDDSD